MADFLQIALIGLIALVPNRDQGTLEIVIPQVGGHKPVIVFPRGGINCDEMGANPCIPDSLTTSPRTLNPSSSFVARILDKQVLSIAAGLDMKEVNKIDFGLEKPDCLTCKATGQVPADQGERSRFGWVPLMSEILGGGGDIASKHLKEGGGSGAAAILSLKGLNGTATVLSLADVGGKVRSFTFKESSGDTVLWGVKGAIADVVLLSLPMNGSQVEFKLRRFGEPADKAESIVVKASGGYADVVLGNLPPYIADDVACKKRNASHFVHFYDLLPPAQVPKKRKLPFPGKKEKHQVDLEKFDDWPPVLQFVEGRGPCIDFLAPAPLSKKNLSTWKLGIRAASNRAICAVASFEASQ